MTGNALRRISASHLVRLMGMGRPSFQIRCTAKTPSGLGGLTPRYYLPFKVQEHGRGTFEWSRVALSIDSDHEHAKLLEADAIDKLG